MEEIPKCLEAASGDCEGEVAWRNTGRGRSWPRCDKHWTGRLRTERQINERYNPFGSTPPAGFDPADAGERWEED